MIKIHLMAIMALSVTTPAIAQGLAGPADIDPTAWRRFTVAAAPVAFADQRSAFLYDFATRCSATAKAVEGEIQWQLDSGSTSTRAMSLVPMLTEGFEDISAMRAGKLVGRGDCVQRINASYGSSFATAAANMGAIARHGISVLRGAAINGPDATADANYIAAAEEARSAISARIMRPILLGLRQSPERTLLIIGEPGSSVRWFAQYTNLADGSWRFEGAYDAPYLR